MRLLWIMPRFSLRTLAIFPLLVTAGVGALFAHWRCPWRLVETKDHGTPPSHLAKWEPLTKEPSFPLAVNRGRAMPEGVIYGGAFSRDWRRFAAGMDDAVRIYDSRSGHCLTVIDVPAMDAYEAAFSADGNVLWVWAHDGLSVWRRRRPEWWWGVFYLWEFWLTALFAAIFVWSVVRDRRALARTG